MDLLAELKKVGEEIKKDFENFKSENDKRIVTLEKGRGVADFEEKLAKNNSNIESLEKKLEEIAVAIKRKGSAEAAVDSDCKEVASSFMRKGKISSEQEAEYRKHLDIIGGGYKGLSVDSEADGGFLVRPAVSATITKKVFESSPVRQVAGSETISTDRWEELYDNDEPDAGWVGERETRTETGTNQLNMIAIPVHEMYAEPKITQKLLDDSALNVEAWHQGKVAEKFARIEASAFVNGDGVKKAKGFLSYASGTGFNQIQQVNSGNASAFTADGLIDLQNALLEEFQMNASWMMKRASAGSVRKLKSTDGAYLWSVDPVGALNGGPMFSLLGKPLRYADDMPAVGANALAAVYGDFAKGYLIIDRIGIRVLRDPLTTKGYVKFYTCKRVGGGVRQFQALKIQKLAV
jgi:HK97 family phage major capsid protein